VDARTPDQIWEQGVDEGERRLKRGMLGLMATGFAGGVEVAFGILATTVVAGAVHEIAPEQVAHVTAALVFGLAFVFITIGRAELFTENFLIPVSGVWAKRSPLKALMRMWSVTLVFNLVGLALFLGLLSVHGVLKPQTIQAAGPLADTYGGRALLPAFVSAVIAGTVMTLFTWVVAAADTGGVRVMLSFIAGFLLVAPSLNHAVVGFGKILFGLFTNTTTSSYGDLVRNLVVSIVGNLIGGVGLVFATRVAQVRGEPSRDAGYRPGADGDGDRPAAAMSGARD
jgi:formate/nitrite transporter FocA (FNT family)